MNKVLKATGVGVLSAAMLVLSIPQAFITEARVAAQTPVDRLATNPAMEATLDDVVQAQVVQTDTLVQMSEAVSRIESIVTDTNAKVATRADVSTILDRLAQCQANLVKSDGMSVSATDPCGPSVMSSTEYVVQPGEVIVAVDGVPVEATTVAPTTVVQQSVPLTTTTVRRPFTTVTTTGPSAGITINRPLGESITTTSNAGACYTDANGVTTCPSYNPQSVDPGVYNTGTSTRRRGLFGGFFRRR